MKILHLTANDGIGGAARAAYRIHKGLVNTGISSQMLVQDKNSNRTDITTPYKTRLGYLYTKSRDLVNQLVQKLQRTNNAIFHSSNILPSGLHRKINTSDADIVHMHWINREMISIKEIKKIRKPIVWTLHDMWAFCGAEHIDDLQSPGRYIEGYYSGNRPQGHSGLDIDKWTWERKKKYWQDLNFHVVAPSKWLANCAQQSLLFSDKDIRVIANGLDVDLFKPVEKERARELMNLPHNKKIVLFGAINSTKNRLKGFKELLEAKEYLISDYTIKNLHFAVFGNKHPHIECADEVKTQYLGTIHKNNELALLYSAADVMVVPSYIESFGQTATEAMACGTPVVAFNTSGLKDIVNHKVNGYLASSYDAKDLANGIYWTLENNFKINRLSVEARRTTLENFDICKISDIYSSLYEEILS